MQTIKNKDYKIELMIRKDLWKREMRYQKNCKKYSVSLILFFLEKMLFLRQRILAWI